MSPARRRVQKETVIVAVGLALFVFEIVWGGGRSWVLPWIVGLVVSPAAVRLDNLLQREKKKELLNDDTDSVS